LSRGGDAAARAHHRRRKTGYAAGRGCGSSVSAGHPASQRARRTRGRATDVRARARPRARSCIDAGGIGALVSARGGLRCVRARQREAELCRDPAQGVALELELASILRERAGNRAAATEALERVLERDPVNAPALQGLLELAVEDARWEAAQGLAEELLEVLP